MYRSAAFLSLLTASLFSSLVTITSSNADEPTRYVRDWMSVPLHATATPDSRIVHNGLVSGTAVTVLESDAAKEYSRVRTAEGSEGWIATRYLSTEPAARAQLEKANAELDQLRKLKAQLADLPPDVRAAAQQVVDLRSENTRLQTELDSSQKTPTEAAQLSAENTRLKTDNATLQQQLATLDTERQLLRAEGDQTKFREGALAVIAGMLLAVGVRRFWPKKRSEWS
ncbi:MAG TPA: TIGR04211 family SH3 domain-containing protein [Spongiibacteraceae bacterium]|nr:TIGR04211 family SH3 domain-containing protein [Spongiibacteraceae bacterium]